VAWRYPAFAEPSGAYLGELALAGVEVTRTLSGPGRLTGRVLPGQDATLLRPWQVSIWAEDEAGTIRGGGFLAPADWTADAATIDCIGRSGYPQSMPWTGDPYAGVQVDPLDVVRRIWAHLQSQPGGDIGVVVDTTTSPVRVGEAEDTKSAAAGSTTTGPVRLDWWSTADLGRVIDDLADATPFDYLEQTAWSGDRLTHRLQLGYPTIGVRRQDVRLALGENLAVTPSLDSDDGDYATEVHALGAGEGRAMVRAPRITRTADGVRRVLLHVDKTARTTTVLTASARAALGVLTGDGRVHQVTVTEHPHAPLGSFDVGDEVYLTGTDGLVTLDRWVRIVALTIRPEDTTSMTLDVQEV
jgi:hypothetical protein